MQTRLQDNFDLLTLTSYISINGGNQISMLFIFSLIIASIFALTAKSTIKRHPYPWYIGALVLTLFISLFPFSRNLPEAVTFLLDLFRRGALSCALWCIVMWTGALSNGSWLIKRLMPVRGELSIFAAMLTLGHNIGYGRTYFVRFFTNASALPANQFAACIITIILLIIMIPLTILSFPKIRKRMKAKSGSRSSALLTYFTRCSTSTLCYYLFRLPKMARMATIFL